MTKRIIAIIIILAAGVAAAAVTTIEQPADFVGGVAREDVAVADTADVGLSAVPTIDMQNRATLRLSFLFSDSGAAVSATVVRGHAQDGYWRPASASGVHVQQSDRWTINSRYVGQDQEFPAGGYRWAKIYLDAPTSGTVTVKWSAH